MILILTDYKELKELTMILIPTDYKELKELTMILIPTDYKEFSTTIGLVIFRQVSYSRCTVLYVLTFFFSVGILQAGVISHKNSGKN